MHNYEAYQTMIKPERSPPGWLFGPVWTLLYVLIIVSYWYVILQIFQKQLSCTIFIPFMINIVANVLFTYLRFTKNNLFLWLIDILVVLITIIITMIIIWPYNRLIAYIQIPYFLRVCFASILAASIFFLNK